MTHARQCTLLLAACAWLLLAGSPAPGRSQDGAGAGSSLDQRLRKARVTFVSQEVPIDELLTICASAAHAPLVVDPSLTWIGRQTRTVGFHDACAADALQDICDCCGLRWRAADGAVRIDALDQVSYDDARLTRHYDMSDLISMPPDDVPVFELAGGVVVPGLVEAGDAPRPGYMRRLVRELRAAVTAVDDDSSVVVAPRALTVRTSWLGQGEVAQRLAELRATARPIVLQVEGWQITAEAFRELIGASDAGATMPRLRESVLRQLQQLPAVRARCVERHRLSCVNGGAPSWVRSGGERGPQRLVDGRQIEAMATWNPDTARALVSLACTRQAIVGPGTMPPADVAAFRAQLMLARNEIAIAGGELVPAARITAEHTERLWLVRIVDAAGSDHATSPAIARMVARLARTRITLHSRSISVLRALTSCLAAAGVSYIVAPALTRDLLDRHPAIDVHQEPLQNVLDSLQRHGMFQLVPTRQGHLMVVKQSPGRDGQAFETVRTCVRDLLAPTSSCVLPDPATSTRADGLEPGVKLRRAIAHVSELSPDIVECAGYRIEYAVPDASQPGPDLAALRERKQSLVCASWRLVDVTDDALRQSLVSSPGRVLSADEQAAMVDGQRVRTLRAGAQTMLVARAAGSFAGRLLPGPDHDGVPRMAFAGLQLAWKSSAATRSSPARLDISCSLDQPSIGRWQFRQTLSITAAADGWMVMPSPDLRPMPDAVPDPSPGHNAARAPLLLVRVRTMSPLVSLPGERR